MVVFSLLFTIAIVEVAIEAVCLNTELGALAQTVMDSASMEDYEAGKLVYRLVEKCERSFGGHCTAICTKHGGKFTWYLNFVENFHCEIESSLFFCTVFKTHNNF
jgi:hypothetical protein